MTGQRIVVVTGAAQGLGKAIAEGFAAAGNHVVVCDIDRSRAQDVARSINGSSLALDVSDAGSVADGITKIERAHHRIDVLVNNAGIVGGGGPLLELDPAILSRALNVNVLGTWLMTRAAGRLMATAQSGAIINISSVGARQPTANLGHYEATKAAIEAITRTSALELARYGIRANAVAPGPIITPLTAAMAANPAARAAWEARIPLGSIADVSMVVPAVLFLASDAARHITGVSLPLDGGQLLV